MKQQINLYHQELRPQKQRLSARQMLQGVAVLVVCLVLWSGVTHWQAARQEQALGHLQEQAAANQQQLAALTKAAASRTEDPRLLRRAEKLTADIQARQEIMAVLSGKSFGNTHGFAEQFTGLARQHEQGMWFTRVAISAGGTQLDLQGSTVQPELVPRYLQRLTREPAFSGINFRSFVLRRAEADAQWIDFHLQSVAEED